MHQLGRNLLRKAGLALLGGCLFVTGCTEGSADRISDPQPPVLAEEPPALPPGAVPRRIPVLVEAVRLEDVTSYRELRGRAQAWEEFRVGSEITGRITRIFHLEGQRVEAGTLLLELDGERRELELQSLKAQLLKAESELQFAEKRLAQSEILLEKGAVSLLEVDSLRNAAEIARSAESVARLAVQRMERELAETQIRAPGSGIILERLVSEGEVVQPGLPLFHIIQTNPVKVLVEVAETDFGRLRVGQTAFVGFEAFEEAVQTGRVHRLHGSASRQTGLFPVELRVDNPGGRIQPGMLASVRLATADFPASLTVPLDSVVEIAGENYVFAVTVDGTVERQRVEIVQRIGDRAIVVGLLSPGNLVVTRGSHNLTHGAAVEIVN